MDSIDLKILGCLTRNARMSASDISSEVALSPSAVIERIKKMEGNGAIVGYTTILDHKKLGKDVVAIMTVVLDHPKYNNGFIAAIASNPHITECLYIAGDFDYYLKIITDDTATLEEILNGIKSIPGVSKTKTNLVFGIAKTGV